MLISREELLAATALPEETVDLPELGPDKQVRMRGLTGAQRDSWEASLITFKGNDRRVNARNARARLISMSAVDEQGKRLFSPADIEALGNLSAKIIQRLYEVALRVSGVTDDEVEELTKNSEDVPSDDSGSDSL